MAPFLFLLLFLSGAASGLIVVTVDPGDDVILPCQADNSSIRAVEWTRPDLEPEYVLLYRDGHLDPDDQHPSFEDRVELVNRDLKDRDVSLILKNVSRHDAGTYECRVRTDGSDPIRTIRTIRTVRLQVTDLIEVTVDPGDDVILSCQTASSSIRAVEWTRPDLEPEYVLLYRDGHLDPTYQHPSFKDRVELVNRDLKDGDVSLILKNVSRHDAGTYECRVASADFRRKKRAIINSEPIRIIRLQVTGSEDRNSSPVDLYLGLAAGGPVVVAAALVGVLMCKRRQNMRSGQPAADDDDDDDDDDEALPDLIEVTVDPGDDVILPCQAADPSIRAVKWTRPDLEHPEYVLYYSNGHLETDEQNPSFEDRVDLVDRELNNGDASLTLKNVSSIDTGIYECRVRTDGSDDSDPIRTVTTVCLQVPDLIEVTVHPGDDVILPCQAAGSSIRAVEWTRPDLEPEYVLLYRDGHLDPTYQHPSFKDRVELVDRDLKDGDVSLTLKNVSSIDNGTYECRVRTDGSDGSDGSDPIRTIRTVRLQVPDLIEVTVDPGDDVILPCQAAGSSIRAVEWTRPDLEPEYVLLYRDGHLDPTYQHPSFEDRVELVDRDLKDGDVSLILKNVSRHDAGTYECRVASAGSKRRKRGIIDSEPIRIVHLQVTDPPPQEAEKTYWQQLFSWW